MGERQAVADDGSRRVLLVSLFLLSASLALEAHRPAQAQTEPAGCEPAIARLVALQGAVEVQRADSEAWTQVTRLDTALCAGDRLRTGALSRAGLHVQPETVVRVDQNTVITLNHSAEEIAVEFFVADLAARAANAQSCGAGYFITRFPKKFKVRTPHMNAAVEGTEFTVETSCDTTRLTVLEGRVSSESSATGDRKLVEAGQSLASGAAGAGAITTVVRPADAVQWVLRFPEVSDQRLSPEVPSIEKCAAQMSGDRAECLTARAEALLRTGSVDDALAAIDAALIADPSSSNGHALRSVVQLAKNDRSDALESAERATEIGVDNFRAWLALSYVQQAGFDLDAALASAKRSQSLAPGSSLAHARVAELLLSLGDVRRAEEAARAAVASNPAESHAHSILGFVHLSRVDTPAARTDFERAIERDSFSALPRLGLGLAMIRDGQLPTGREQLEIAVALDPSNSLLRSYVGKAYYEENSRDRDELAAIQFDLADRLDPNDPTSRLYDAIRLQTANQPVNALRAIRESIARNDNRAVFRSKFKLDEDLAVRAASQGRIYRDLSFYGLALLKGWQSVNTDPGDFSGHRLLADVYSSVPQHEIARVNELFTSQLLQPLNLTPVPPQLGETNLFILDSAGPSDIAFNEFTPLFERDGWRLNASATVAGNDTWGNDLSLAAVQGRFSMSFGQYHFETDGFGVNNDLNQDSYNAYLQFRVSDSTSLMTELRYSDRTQGDLRRLFNPESTNPTIRTEEQSESIRFGVHHQLGARAHVLASLVYQNPDLQITDPPFFDSLSELESYTAELQSIYNGTFWRIVSGIRQVHREQEAQESVFGDVTLREFEFDSSSAYAYASLGVGDAVGFDIGASADLLEGRSGESDRFNPKVGVTWQASDRTNVRLAIVSTTQPDTFTRQDVPPRLEPTQVAGFNQVYTGPQGERAWQYAVAIDLAMTEDVFLGAKAMRRDLEIPFVQLGPPDIVEFADAEALAGNAYWYWMPLDVLASRVEYRYDKRENEGFASFPENIEELETHRFAAGARYFHPSGFSAEAVASYVDQKGRFLEFLPGPPFVQFSPADDQFWVLDVSLSYRLPGRNGIITLGADNVTDEEFRFQDVDPENPEVVPERLVSLKATVAF